MAYLNKEQYEYRKNSAAERNAHNEEIAISNGMTKEQADMITILCGLRHELHTNIDKCADSSENGILAKIDKLNEEIRLSGLDGVSFSADGREVAMIDDIDGLMEYSDDIPKTTIVKIMMLGIGRTKTASSASFFKRMMRLKSTWVRLIRNTERRSVQPEY